MKTSDRELGMGRAISRRDFMHGAIGAVVGASALTARSGTAETNASPSSVGQPGLPHDSALHPPSRLGARGSHPGSFDVAHEMAFGKRTDWGLADEPDASEYDLVVVGAGLSGLAAAVFYREEHPGARILLLDNHDDFGGHAKRNEFEFGGRTILGYGGSQSMEGPSSYSDEVKVLFKRLGVKPKRLADAYDQAFFQRHDLGIGVYFDRAHYGVDRVVRTGLLDQNAFIKTASSGTTVDESIDKMPLSESARAELKRIIESSDDRIPEHSILGEGDYLSRISYLDYITKHLNVKEPEVVALLQDMPSNYLGHGIDVCPALDAMLFGLPGLRSTSLGLFDGLLRWAIPHVVEPYIYHFPDGNASLARMMVRNLIPGVAEGSTMEDIVDSQFNYAMLDNPKSDVRLRLDSTVVRVAHEGDPKTAKQVGITYVRQGRTERIRAKQVVLACYNMAIPYLCPELPASQREALRSLVKIPFVYTNVLLSNWRASKKLGLAVAHCPGSWHKFAMLDFPVSIGDYKFSSNSDEPIVVHMSSPMVVPGLPPREQSRAGRHKLLGTPFQAIEREVRIHLAGMLGAGGFDPARDIQGIAVNRWPHGYAFEPSLIFDPEYGPGEAPHEVGRRTFGRIAIANSDAGARAYLDEAIDQGYRAVTELAN